MSKRRRADMGAQGIKVGPRAFALFKRKINKIYKMTIYGKDEAQYLYKLKLKARKKYNDAEEIEVFVKKPLILTGLYDEEENRDNLPITIEAEPVEDDMIETEGTIVEDDMLQVNAVIIDAIFFSVVFN